MVLMIAYIMVVVICYAAQSIMAYGSTPYVGMTPKKNGGHIESHKWHAQKVCDRSVNGLHEPYQALSSSSMGNRTINFAGKHR